MNSVLYAEIKYTWKNNSIQASRPPGLQASRLPGLQAYRPPGLQALSPPGHQASNHHAFRNPTHAIHGNLCKVKVEVSHIFV